MKIFLLLLILISFIRAGYPWSTAQVETSDNGVSMVFNTKNTSNTKYKRSLAGVYVTVPFASNCNKVVLKILVKGEAFTNNMLNINGRNIKFDLGKGFTTLMHGKNITRQYIEPASESDKNFLVNEFILKRRVVFVENNNKTHIITGMGFTRALAGIKQICQEEVEKIALEKKAKTKKILSFLLILGVGIIGVIISAIVIAKYLKHRKIKKVIKTMHDWSEVEIQVLSNNVYMEDYTITTVGKAHKRTIWTRIMMTFNNCSKIDIKFSVMGEPFAKVLDNDSKENIFDVNGKSIKFKIGKNFTGFFIDKEIPKQYIWAAMPEDAEFILNQFKTAEKVVLTHHGKKIYTVTTKGFNEALANLSKDCEEKRKIK